MKFRATDREIVRVEDLYPRPKPSYNPTKRAMNDDDKKIAYQRLRSNPNVRTGTEWLLSPEPEKVVNIINTIDDIVNSAEFIMSENKPEHFLKVY